MAVLQSATIGAPASADRVQIGFMSAVIEWSLRDYVRFVPLLILLRIAACLSI